MSKKAEEMKLSSRSAYEMSKGDLLRRETSHRMMKLRVEREGTCVAVYVCCCVVCVYVRVYGCVCVWLYAT